MKLPILSSIRTNREKPFQKYLSKGILKNLPREKMGKAVVKIDEKDLNAHEVALLRAKKALGEKCICCILITCSDVEENGNMQVEMHFDGDESLAAFLLENANQVFENRFSERKSK